METGSREATARGEGLGLAMLEWNSAILYNGLGRHAEALAAARRASEQVETGVSAGALAELVEAGVRGGSPAEAAGALDRLGERTQACGTDWALGVEAGSRALLSEAGCRRAALPRVGRAARAHPRGRPPRPRPALYGEWLRRESRRVDAREQLRAAHETFSRSAPRRSPSAPGASCRPPARPSASSPSTRATRSPRRRPRSPAWPARGSRTRRSAPGCSSARAPSSTTCASSIPSSTSSSRKELPHALAALDGHA